MAPELSALAFLNPQSGLGPLRFRLQNRGGWTDAEAAQYYLDNEAMTNEGGNTADITVPVSLAARWNAHHVRSARTVATSPSSGNRQ